MARYMAIGNKEINP